MKTFPRAPRGVLLLEMIVYCAILMVLMSTVVGSLALVSHSLHEGTIRERLTEQRNDVAELLRDDLRMAQTIAWVDVKAKDGKLLGSKLRLTQSGDTVVEYTFDRKVYDVTYEAVVPAPQPKISASGRRTPPPVISDPATVTVTQSVEDPPMMTRTLLVHDVQKAARSWSYYALSSVSRSPQKSSGNVWELTPLKHGDVIDAHAGHVFVSATLESVAPGKPTIPFTVGATTRLESATALAPATEKP